jgi:sugar phosphate isomerase/epimerase
VRALAAIKYSGACSLEYEKDMDKPLLGIAESIGYFRGVMDAVASV